MHPLLKQILHPPLGLFSHIRTVNLGAVSVKERLCAVSIFKVEPHILDRFCTMHTLKHSKQVSTETEANIQERGLGLSSVAIPVV